MIDPGFKNELDRLGRKSEWNECYHCGNCTAVCSLTERKLLFPRKDIRYIQMGLKDKLTASTDPWMCYYCGDCTETCPRDANPGELMMAARRWLITRYDWTGLSGLFFRSLTATVVAMVLVAAGILAAAFSLGFDHQAVMHFGHRLEFTLITGVFALILLPNIIRMFCFTVIKPGARAPVTDYIKAIGDLFIHMFSQVKTLKCDRQTFRWLSHLLVVAGYLGLLVITVFFNWFGTENQFIIRLGYVTGGLVFVFTFILMTGRFSKSREMNKFSHQTDWFFIVWLFLMGLTAFMVRLFIDLDLLNNHFWLYMTHIIILAQWGLILVPFGKWTHFLYRSFAVAFSNLKQAALSKEPELSLATAE